MAAQNQVFQFGSGVLFATPTVGDTSADITPMQFGTLQDVQVDISYDVKELYGRNQFPDDATKGKGKISCKAKYAKIVGKLSNDLLFGQSIVTGTTQVAIDVLSTVAAGAVTVVPPGSGTFKEDLGVRYSATGIGFVKKASAPAVGQYSNSGTTAYTFNVTDNGTLNVMISFAFTVTTGFTANIQNKLMGYGPKFACYLYEQYGGNQTNAKLYRCIGSKLTRPTKNEDYMIQEFDFAAFSDDAGNVIDFYDAQ